MDRTKLTVNKYKKLLADLLSSPPVPIERSFIPETHGVYRIFQKPSSRKSSLYVGEGNLRVRIYHGHLMGNVATSAIKRKLAGGKKQLKSFIWNKCLVQYIEIQDPVERKLFEHFAISVLKPLCND